MRKIHQSSGKEGLCTTLGRRQTCARPRPLARPPDVCSAELAFDTQIRTHKKYVFDQFSDKFFRILRCQPLRFCFSSRGSSPSPAPLSPLLSQPANEFSIMRNEKFSGENDANHSRERFNGFDIFTREPGSGKRFRYRNIVH